MSHWIALCLIKIRATLKLNKEEKISLRTKHGDSLKLIYNGEASTEDRPFQKIAEGKRKRLKLYVGIFNWDQEYPCPTACFFLCRIIGISTCIFKRNFIQFRIACHLGETKVWRKYFKFQMLWLTSQYCIPMTFAQISTPKDASKFMKPSSCSDYLSFITDSWILKRQMKMHN